MTTCTALILSNHILTTCPFRCEMSIHSNSKCCTWFLVVVLLYCSNTLSVNNIMFSETIKISLRLIHKWTSAKCGINGCYKEPRIDVGAKKDTKNKSRLALTKREHSLEHTSTLQIQMSYDYFWLCLPIINVYNFSAYSRHCFVFLCEYVQTKQDNLYAMMIQFTTCNTENIIVFKTLLLDCKVQVTSIKKESWYKWHKILKLFAGGHQLHQHQKYLVGSDLSHIWTWTWEVMPG